jgi:prepilin-type N-terminal cleavage/methylation domain-containing protein
MIMSSLRKLGFTMIELLIVIAVLGILAVAVLASINPIEQINRGRDTGSRSDAEQLVSAVDRFYAAKGYYPWMDNGASLNTSTDLGGALSAGNLLTLNAPGTLVGNDGVANAGIDVLDLLSAGGTAELKASFTSRIVDPQASNYLSIYNSGVSGESTYVCFVPKSASFREEAWKRCDVGGVINPDLPADFPTGVTTPACPTTACVGETSSMTATGCYICLP